MKFDLEGKKTFEAIGCKKCNETGYLGRIGIFEVMILNDKIRSLISDNKPAMEIRNEGITKWLCPISNRWNK